MPAQTTPTPVAHGVLNFRIIVDDVEISTSFYSIKSILVIRELNKIPFARIVMDDGSAALMDFPASNEDRFIPGKKIEIHAGFGDNTSAIFKGVIHKHSIQIKITSGPQLIVECRDEAVRLTLNHNSRYFENMKDSEAIQQILDEFGLSMVLEQTNVTHKEIVQYHCSDWDFIVSRADANGMFVFADNGFVKMQTPVHTAPPSLLLTFGSNMLEFDAEMDSRYQFGHCEVKSWDASGGVVRTDVLKDEKMREPGNISGNDLSAQFAYNYIINHEGSPANEATMEISGARHRRSRLSKIRGRVRCTGVANVLPNSLIEINGVGDRFNGKAWVSGVRHEIARGLWTTDIQLGSSHRWFAEENEITPEPATASLPAIHGLHVGIVTDLEDPDGEFRVKVRMPMISMSDEGVWCRVATLDAGNNRGTFFRPEIGDEVVLGFFDDDPRYPVVLGMMHSGKNASPLTPANANDEKGLVTRSGMKMIFDDQKKSFMLQTPAGKKIIIDEQGKQFLLADEHGNRIEMNPDGMTIKSRGTLTLSGGTVSISGGGISVKGSDVKIEGSGSAELKSGGVVTVQGALVKIN
jgi:Rhs element Vgr protein